MSSTLVVVVLISIFIIQVNAWGDENITATGAQICNQNQPCAEGTNDTLCCFYLVDGEYKQAADTCPVENKTQCCLDPVTMIYWLCRLEPAELTADYCRRKEYECYRLDGTTYDSRDPNLSVGAITGIAIRSICFCCSIAGAIAFAVYRFKLKKKNPTMASNTTPMYGSVPSQSQNPSYIKA